MQQLVRATAPFKMAAVVVDVAGMEVAVIEIECRWCGLVTVLCSAALALCACAGLTLGPAGEPKPEPAAGNLGVGLANPASAHCQEQGYTLEMRSDESGNQTGVCVFPDGSECEEWAFFRGECGPGFDERASGGGAGLTVAPAPVPAVPSGASEIQVVGWLGYVVGLPEGAQFDDYVVLQPAGAGELGLTGVNEDIEAQIVALRDMAEPGKYVHFWGALTCGVPDHGGCQVAVSQIRGGATLPPEPDPVVGWEGVIVSNPPGAQFDDYFVLNRGFPVAFGIEGYGDDASVIHDRLADLRDTGTAVRVWGSLVAGLPDAFGSQIQVMRMDVVEQLPAPSEDSIIGVEAWRGTIVKLPPGNQHGQIFRRDDGEEYGIDGVGDMLREQLSLYAWTGAQVQIWGELAVGGPSFSARHIAVERLEVMSDPADEPRNLVAFADVSASSMLPAGRGGTYHPYAAIDGLPETAWAEGVAGPGLREWVLLTFPGTIEVHSVGLDGGLDRDADVFSANNRIKQVTLEFSSGETLSVPFQDVRGIQNIPLVRALGSNIKTDWIKIVIEDVFEGTRYDDTCLSEIEVWGRTK